MFAKPLERADARRLRRDGMSIKRIAAILEVSPSSALAWTKDIELTADQRARLREACRSNVDDGRLRRAHEAWAAECREKREEYQREGRERARARDPQHQAGCMLYWAEGTKARNVVGFSNSDHRMLAMFRSFLTESLGVEASAIRISLNVYTSDDLSIADVEDHWLEALDLPRACLRKHTVDHFPTSSSGRGRRKLPYGVCALRVNSTRAVQHIYGAIQEYAGFSEPAWLD